MISTVTTSTVSTVAAAALAGSVAMIGILVLLALLVQKELTSSVSGGRWHKLALVVNVGIAPLMIAFLLVLIARVSAALR